MRLQILLIFTIGMCCLCFVGCATPHAARTEARHETLLPNPFVANQNNIHSVADPTARMVQQVNFQEVEEIEDEKNGEIVEREETKGKVNESDESQATSNVASDASVKFLVETALDQNPRLVRLYREYQAAAARSQYVDKLPDPRLGANVFGNPIETASGSQRANMNLSQTIPWLGKLNAEQQRACLEALAVRAEFAAERLRVIAEVRAGWYRLYVIDRQIETTDANQQLLESLIDVANARIATGEASTGDVLLGTLELSQLEERLLTYRKQRRAVEAELNRLMGRAANTSILSPTEIMVNVPQLDAATTHQTALSSQPEFEAARLRTQATRWGIEVARLSRRPEFSLSANYFFTDDNRPASTVVDVGEDPWSLGVQFSIPIWHEKYDAMRNEATWKHHAAHSSVQELSDRYDTLILDLITEAERAADTARLYKSTILPQARQTLAADQNSYSNGTVEFDRVIRDYRSLLTLELGYQQAIGDLAIAHARLQQAAGQDFNFSQASNATLEQ